MQRLSCTSTVACFTKPVSAVKINLLLSFSSDSGADGLQFRNIWGSASSNCCGAASRRTRGGDEVLLARPILVAGSRKARWLHLESLLENTSAHLLLPRSHLHTLWAALEHTHTRTCSRTHSLSLSRHLGRSRAVEKLHIQAWPWGQLIDR